MDPEITTRRSSARGVPAVLRDGSRVRIRQWSASDRDLLVDGFYRLSARSSYRRFLTTLPVLSQEAVQTLTDVDHRDREAMIALDEHARQGLSIARYARSLTRPEVAEVALTVIDDWQGRGLGTLMLDVISARARQNGITTFMALMLVENREMRHLLDRLGPVRVIKRRGGSVEVEVAIPDVTLSPELRDLLRIAALGVDTDIPLSVDTESSERAR